MSSQHSGPVFIVFVNERTVLRQSSQMLARSQRVKYVLSLMAIPSEVS